MVPREVRYVKTVALCHSSCTTNGWRTWCTVAGNHKPYGSRRAHPLLFTISLSLSLSSPLLSIRRLSFSPTTSSASISPGYAFHMAFGWLLLPSPGFSLPPPPLLSLSLCLSIRRPSLYLSIVHNYTIRLLNRLMRPLLPALAAPFTETTTDEHESMCLSLCLSFPLLFSFTTHRPSLSLFLSFHFASSRKTLTGYVTLPAFLPLAIHVSTVLLPVNPLVSSRSLFFPVRVYAPRVARRTLQLPDSAISFLSGVNTVSFYYYYYRYCYSFFQSLYITLYILSILILHILT